MTKITRDRELFLSNQGQVYLTEEDCLKAEKHSKKADYFSIFIFGIFILLMTPQFLDIYENGFPKAYKITEGK